MKIGIHTGSAFCSERTGVEEYIYQLIKNIAKLKGQKNYEFILYVNPKTVNFIPVLPENFKIKKLNCPFLWTKIRLSFELFLHPVDILFLPANFLPLFYPKNTITTIHGLEFEYLPKDYSKKNIYYLRQGTKEAVKKAKKIIAVSENTKKDLLEIYRSRAEKIEVIHHGVVHKKNEAEKKRPIEEKYILYIGRLETKKNIKGIIEAFNEFKIAYNASYKLVLAGKEGDNFSKFKNTIEKSPYKNDIILTGYISQVEKEKFLENADIFLFPSFYEGFGMPILEAQERGIPVITSNTSSMPEVAGEKGALFVDPNNAEDIANAIKKLAEDENLRQDLIEQGEKNAEKYSWEKCATETLEFLLK
jgi:glycosyltransferase involved in cell wall biosynthesis